MTDRSLLVALGVKDADKAIADLRRFGDDGARALDGLATSAERPSRAMVAVDDAVKAAGVSLGTFTQGAGAAGAALSNFGVVGVAAAAGIGSVALAWGRFTTAVGNADALAKAADRIGITVEALQELRFAGARAGVEVAALDDGLSEFNIKLGEAARSGGTVAEVMGRLGVEFKTSTGELRSADAVLADVADAIANLGNQAERADVANALFGGAGRPLLTLLQQGSEAIDGLRERARDLGLVLSEEVARDAERTSDALGTFGDVIEVNVNRALLAAAPLVASLVEGIADLFVAVKNFELIEGGPIDADRLGGAALLAEIDSLRAEIVEREREIAAASAEAVAEGAADGLRTGLDGLNVALEALRADLDAAIAEARKRGLVAGEVVATATAGAYSPSQIAAAREEIDKLFGVLDPLVKLEQDHADALASVRENRAAFADDGEYEAALARVNELFTERREKLDKANEATDRHKDKTRDVISEYDRLIGSLDSTAAAFNAFDSGLAIVERLMDEGEITLVQYTRALELLGRKFDETTTKADKLAVATSGVSGATASAAAVSSGFGFGSAAAGIGRQAIGAIASGAGPGDLASIISNAVSNRVLGFLGDTAETFLTDGPGAGLDSVLGAFRSFGSGATNVAQQFAYSSLGRALGLSQVFTGATVPAATAAGITGGVAGAGGEFFASSLAAGSSGLPGLTTAGATLAGAAPFIAAFAAIAVPILLSLFQKESSGPASSSTFAISRGRVAGGVVGTDNDGDPEIGRQIQASVVDLFNTALDGLGARIAPNFLDGAEVGFVNRQFRTNVRPGGLSPEGDQAPGDLRSFGDNAAAAVLDFVVRGLDRAVAEGALDGLADGAAEILERGLSRVAERITAGVDEAGLEDIADDLSFLTGFTDFEESVRSFGDALAIQTKAIRETAADLADTQSEFVADFVERARRLLGPLEGDGIRAFPVTAEDIRRGAGLSVEDQFADANRTSGFTLIAAQVDDARAGFRFGQGVEGIYRRDPADLDPAAIVDRVRLDPDNGGGAPDQEFFVLQNTPTSGDEVRQGFQGIRVGGVLLSRGRDEGGRNSFFNEAGDKIQAYERNGPGQRTDLVFDTEEMARFVEQSGGSLSASSDPSATETSEEFERATRAIQDYSRQLIDQVVGIEGSTEAMTGFRLALFTGEEQIRALAPVLEEAGLTAEQAAAEIEGGIDRLRDKIRDDFNESVERATLALKSPQAQGVLDFADQIEALRDQATAVGGDMEAVNELIAEQARALSGEAEARRESIAETEAEVAAITAARDANQAYLASLRSFRDQLRLGGSSRLLADADKLPELEARLADAVAAARGGDDQARRDVQSLATRIFELSTSLYASGPDAIAAQSRTIAAVDGLIDGVRDEIQIAEDQLSVANQSLASLRSIEASLGGPGGLPSGFSLGANQTRNRLLAQLFPEFVATSPEGFGDGRFSSFFGGRIAAGDFRVDAANSIISAVGFADGGDHIGGGRFVGGRGVEFEATNAARIHSTEAIVRAIAGLGGAAKSDTASADMIRAVERVGAGVARSARAVERAADRIGALALVALDRRQGRAFG